MKIRKTLFILIFAFGCIHSFGQEEFQINNTTWQFELPENFFREDIIENSDIDGKLTHILELVTPDSPDMNFMSVTTYPNFNYKLMSADVYANSVLKSLKNDFLTDNLEAEMYLDRTEIDGISFYVIHSDVRDPFLEERYMASVYLAEIDDKELNITILYDNDEDGFALENALFNSKFTQQ